MCVTKGAFAPCKQCGEVVTNLALLEIKNLHVALEDGTEIVRGVDLSVNTGEVHAVMGPNGSGKSTLAYALMGHPSYEITEGEILLDGQNLVELGADERAQRGLFLAFQYPQAIPGVTVASFLRSAVNAIRKARAGGEDDPVKIPEFRKQLTTAMESLKVPKEMTSRYINEGFSGGEKKRVEILQMAMLQPRSPCSTRPTPDWTSMRCESSPKASSSSSAPRWAPRDHALPADPELHHA